jgi:hypothetical protein
MNTFSMLDVPTDFVSIFALDRKRRFVETEERDREREGADVFSFTLADGGNAKMEDDERDDVDDEKEESPLKGILTEDERGFGDNEDEGGEEEEEGGGVLEEK